MGLVDVYFPGHGCVVSLPTSVTFRAQIGSRSTKEFDIFRLTNAVVDADVNVVLEDGTRLRAVEVVPGQYKPSVLDDRILKHVIALVEGRESRRGPLLRSCYRRIREGLPQQLQDGIPELAALDYSRVRELRVPYLKEIKSYAENNDPKLSISIQKIADALAVFGIPPGRRRPLKNRANATI
jgi:hypothetical protein